MRSTLRAHPLTAPGPVRESERMTATLSAKGHLVIPQQVRASHQLKAGTDFTVITRKNGDILLRPVKTRRHHATLAENLLALSGLKLDPERASARDIEL